MSTSKDVAIRSITMDQDGFSTHVSSCSSSSACSSYFPHFVWQYGQYQKRRTTNPTMKMTFGMTMEEMMAAKFSE